MPRDVFSIPLLPHHYCVVGVTDLVRLGYNLRYFYDGTQCVYYELQPYWKNVAEGGAITAPYCVEMVHKKVCVLVRRTHDSFARGLASLLGMKIVVTARLDQVGEVRGFLNEREVRYTETMAYRDDRVSRFPFNLDDPDLDIATELRMRFSDVQIKRSKLPDRLLREPLCGPSRRQHFFPEMYPNNLSAITNV